MATELDDLKALIIDGAKGDDRSQQVALGPSEVGHPCLRKLALGLLHAPKVNSFDDPLPSVVGTGAHSRVEDFAQRANARLVAEGKPSRWLAEHRVTVREGLAGTCDLYDMATNTVIDWKFPGTSRMDTYRRQGPSETYRRQAHLYGRGWRNLGLPVEHVGICFLPRGGQLKHAHLWTEPYSDAVVDETLARIDTVTALIWDLQLGEHPERINDIPATPDGCWVCPYQSRHPGPFQCMGGKDSDTTVSAPQGAFAL
ncbi:hypothetical protein [Gordonia sp. N1V]|uniref:hypothetical protein n=1 Tax=Gordonia sp. N1V TaxID=3034163 RepID=UPI0023E2891E|nr:hypothetical protein [Gordonia sp. N1V]MDF3280452.1 hypothetical protein [Gordonia sp. N1V]